MKIGIDASNLEGQRTGVGRYLINILQEWNKLDNSNLEIILYFRKEIPDNINLNKFKFKKKLLKFGSISNAFFMHILLAIAAYKDNLDILFCPAYVSPIFYFKKTALTLHDIIYEVRPDLYNWPSIFDKILLKIFSKISAKKASVIFVPSEYTKKEVIKYYKINPNKIFVTYLGIDSIISSFCHSEPKAKNLAGVPTESERSAQRTFVDAGRRYAPPARSFATLRMTLGIKNKFIFFYGSISNRRHLPEAMLAFEKVAKKLLNYQFLIIGKNITSPFINIDNLAYNINKKLNKKAILRKDFVSDEKLALLYNSAELLIWLSEYEGFGLPVLEAISNGVPVITSPITSIPEVAGDAALYVQDPNDINNISENIYKILTNNKLREKLIKKSLEQAKKFSWQICAKSTLTILRR